MEEGTSNEYKEVMEEVEEIKKANVGINSTTEALLVMIYQSLDTIRFHNTD